MSGKRRSTQVRQFASDLLVGLVISLTVLAFSIVGSCEAKSAQVVATPSGSIVVEGHPIGMRGPLAQDGYDRVMSLHAIGLGKSAMRLDDAENTASETPVQQAQLTTRNRAPQALWGQGYVANREQPANGWTLVTMALIFGLMTALTLGLWRSLSRAVSPDGRRRG